MANVIRGVEQSLEESSPALALAPVEAGIEDDTSKRTTATPDRRRSSASQNDNDRSVTDDVSYHTSADGNDVEKGPTAPATSHDPNVVDFDGPDDPEKAINWPKGKKWGCVALLSAMTLITPLASSMFAPGVPEVLRTFNSDSSILGSIVVSVYVLGYAAGPIIIAPCSEIYGRTIVYHVGNALFIVFTIACAVSSNLNMLIGFRFLEGIAGSTPVTIGGGTIADLFVQEERGGAMSIWSMGPLLGPVIGPIAGGFLSESEGWRWVFWVIAIAAGVISILFVLLLNETYPSVILQKKTNKLRKETGNMELRSKMDSGMTPTELFKHSIVRPLKMLIFQPIVLILSLFMAVVYGYLYLLFTTITEVFESSYGFSGGVVGLTFLGIGVGMFIGLFTFGFASDRSLKAKKAKGIALRPEDRLPLLIPGSMCVPIGLFIYGWTAQYHVFWFVPIFGTSFVGLGLIATFMPMQTYLVDAFTVHASSAIAACTIIRSVLGALLPLAGPSMYATLGLGWGNSLLAFIAVALIPVPFLLIKYGESIRTNPRFHVNL